ncbi:MAG: MFS transporter [Gammaproteobacteria bacterium]|nr:MFS transporter [Gammaproteobacteria bacterium]
MLEGARELAQAMRGYPARVFAICLAGWVLTNMDQSFFGYAVPSIMQEFGIGLPVIGNILSTAFILATITVVVVGVLADRYGRRVMFVACLALSALLVGLQGLSTSLWTLAMLRCFAFALSTGLVPITNAFVVEAAPDRYRGVVSGLLQCGYPLGWFLSSLLATPLITHYGWRYMFLPALAVIPIALWLGKMLPESRRFEREQPHKSATDTARAGFRLLLAPQYRRRVLCGWLAFFLFGGAYAGTAFYFPTFYQVVRGYSAEDATFVVGLAYGIGILGYIGASLVGEFVTTRRNTIVIWLWTGAIGVTGVIWNQQGFWANVLWFSVTAMFFYGVAAVLTTYIAEIFPTRIRATAVAVVAGVGINLGFAVFPVLVAELVERYGWPAAFSIAVIPCLVVAGLVTLLMPNLSSTASLEDVATAR